MSRRLATPFRTWRLAAALLPLAAVPTTVRAQGLAASDTVGGAASAHVHVAPELTGGRVEGRIRVGRALEARRARFRAYADAGAAVPPAAASADDQSALRGVVVWLEGVPRTASADDAAAPAAARMEQKNERFLPRVLPVAMGTTVAFPNGDPIFHNVFSLSSARTFDLGRYPRGDSRSVRFDKPGIVQVFCHIHNDMRAFVLVLDTPAYAMPGTDGRYALAGIPAGEYTLVAWHERASPIRRRVRVSVGGTTVENVDIPVVEESR